MENKLKIRSCRKRQILLGEYVLGTIGERDRARFERHLARCARCRRDLVETEKTYRLLGNFELAKPGPFLAAKVARAVGREAQAAVPGITGERARADVRRWLRTPAFATVLAAASVAVVATVLYIKVWLPRAPEGVEGPAAGKVASAAKAEKAAEERLPFGPRTPRPEAVPPSETGRPSRETAAAEEPVAEEEGGFAAEAPYAATVPAEADKLATLEARAARPEAAPPAKGRRPSREIAAAGKAAATPPPAKEKGRAFAEGAYPATGAGEPDKLAARAPFMAAALPRDYAVSRGARDEMGRYGRAAANDVERGEFAKAEEKTLVAAEVEGWMDARFEADVERLTGDGAALVDYVTPNGSLMAYFYELSVDEQKTLLSRLRREAEAESAADLLLSY